MLNGWKTYLELNKPIKVFFDNEDFGIFKYNQEKKRYEGCIGYIDIKDIPYIIKNSNRVYHIRIEMIKE